MNSRKIRALLLSPLYDQPCELPPMGLLYLAGYFRGHPRIELHLPHCSLTDKNFEALIAEREYDAICTGGMLTYIDTYARFLDRAAKLQPKALRVLGGPVVSAFPGATLYQELDFHVGVVGEGEATLEDLLQAHADGRPFHEVPGILHRGLGGEPLYTEPRKPIDLKTVNLAPDWSAFDIEDYFRRAGNRTIFLMGSRGCPNRCHYCNSTIRGYRIRPIPQVIEEIRETHAAHSLDFINFRDETFMANHRRIQEFCRAYMESGIGLRWGCGLRTNVADAETLRLMRRAGCEEIQYGVESGSDRVLQRMNKHVTAEQNRQAILDTQEAGINRGVSVMFGYLDETEEDVRRTIDLLIETNELPKYYSLTTPVPGTVLYDDCAARGLVADPVAHARTMNKAIYLAFPPDFNMSAIPDQEFFPFLREELARLHTAHFHNNQARVLDFAYEHGREGSCRAACPHCGAELAERVGYLKWSYQLFCPSCRRHSWVALASIPPFDAHFRAVSAFLDRMEAQGGKLVLRATANDFVYGNVAKVDPWGRVMRPRPKIISETPYRFHLEEWGPTDDPAGAWVLIMDMDPDGALADSLVERGFRRERIQAALPTPASCRHEALAQADRLPPQAAAGKHSRAHEAGSRAQ